ncbi:MAG: HlyC/CorC family transporter [Actinobacteria bacterium]|nr:HlyC/CorC family transporter [Actinomycetota bacterium]
MRGTDWLIVLAVLLLFLASIWLALAETAFVCTSRVRALALEEEGHKGAAKLARLLERPEQTLNIVLALALFTQLTSAALLGALLRDLVGVWGFAAGLVVQFILFFVVGEVAPKTYAVQHTDRAALRVAGVLTFLTQFPPLRAMSRGLIGMANLLLPGRGLKRGPFVTEEDVRAAADVAADDEEIEREERRLIHSIFEFGDTVVREVMLPRPDMVAIEASATVDEGIARAIEGGFSRIPCYEGDTDNILGLVYLKDLVRHSQAGEGDQPVRIAVRDAVVVPEQKRVAELLKEMQQQQFHMAIVVDEHGGTAGLVTLEDLLEEIVGEITDEYDIEEPRVEHLPGGALRVPGRTSIDDVNEELGIELPDDEWDTVGGLVFNLLGKVPAEGETVSFQGFEFVTERVQGNRIVSVQIRPAAGGERTRRKRPSERVADAPPS